MKMSRGEYGRMIDAIAPKSKTLRNCLGAFLVGGLICTLGQVFVTFYKAVDLNRENASTAASMTLILLSAVLSGFAVYDDIAKFAGAGTIVPITGFANAIVSPAVEYKTEGLVLGTAAKMFTIAGPVIVYGVSASVVYGIIYWITTLF
ncbi:MAG: stage V sporulation protein AC [Oscillospiraceae bacterium]|nr:stage V sporulation protein AC [Oscillospiraceae bacterium]